MIEPIEMDIEESPEPTPRLVSAEVLPMPMPANVREEEPLDEEWAPESSDVTEGGTPDVIAALQMQSQAVMASIAAFQEAERARAERNIQAERDEAEQRLNALKSEIDEARTTAILAEEDARSARSDADDILTQFTTALDQVRNHATLVETLRQENDALSVTASAARNEADWIKGQWAVDRERAASLEERVTQADRRIVDAEMVTMELRSEVESLRRVLSARGVRSLTANVAGDDIAQGTTIFPVQVTAVIDCKSSSDGEKPGEAGVGVVLDVRLVAAIPQEMNGADNGVESAVNLARALFPTAPLSVVVGEDCEITNFQAQHNDVMFIAAPADDSRRKAAKVLASAAGHLTK